MNDSRLTVIQIQLEALDELYKVYQEEFKQVGNQLRDLFIDIKPQTISPQRLGETHLFQQPQNTNTTNMKMGKQKFSKKTKSKSKERNKNHKSTHSKDKKQRKYKHKKQLSSTSSSQSSSSLQSLSSSTFSSISSSSSSESVKKYKKRIKPVQKLKLILPKMNEYEIDAKPMNNNQISSIVEYNFNGHRRLSCNKNLLERVDRIMNNDEQNKQKEQQDDSQLEDLRCELKNHLEIGNNIRYYQMNPFEQCYRCKSSGHHEKQCILPIAQLCNYCLDDHTGDKCNNFCCFKCNQIGHRKQDCKFKQLLPYCIYCSRTTHLSEKCQVIRSTLTQSDTICLNCRQLGHINCNNTTANY